MLRMKTWLACQRKIFHQWCSFLYFYFRNRDSPQMLGSGVPHYRVYQIAQSCRYNQVQDLSSVSHLHNHLDNHQCHKYKYGINNDINLVFDVFYDYHLTPQNDPKYSKRLKTEIGSLEKKMKNMFEMIQKPWWRKAGGGGRRRGRPATWTRTSSALQDIATTTWKWRWKGMLLLIFLE